MDDTQLQLVKKEVENIEAHDGHGEVVIKVKNGYFWRILVTTDKILTNNKKPAKVK